MKTRVPINENPVYTKILYCINNKKLYASEIAINLKKAQATVQRQLIYLVDMKYIIAEDHPEKIKNIKLFSINWNKITKEYYDLLLSTSKDRLDSYDDYLSESLPQFKKSYEPLRSLDKFKNEIMGNELLIKIFKNVFINMNSLSDIYDVISLKLFFIEFSAMLSYGEDYIQHFKETYKLNQDEEKFLRKLSHICHLCSHNLLVELAFFSVMEMKDEGENDLKVAKPTESKEKKAGNTNQNKALSSETKQHHNLK